MTDLTHSQQLPAAVAKADNLPSLPTVAVEVLRLTRDEDTSLDDLAQVISQDPALCSKLLRLANSARFSRGHETTTLQQAMMVLGMKVVTMMSLGFSLAQSLPKGGDQAFDYSGYWRRSLVTAVAAQLLARRVGSARVDEAFLCGLLSHIGQMVLGHSVPEVYAPVLARADGAWPTVEMESELLGFHSLDVAGALLQSWDMPALILRPAASLADDGDKGVQELSKLLSVARLAASLACDEPKGEALQGLCTGAKQAFQMDQDAVDEFVLELEPAIAEAARTLQVELPQGLGHQAILDQARLQIVDLSLNATADLEAAERRATTLEVKNRELHDKATTDALTGLPNRGAFDTTLAREVELRSAGSQPGALGLLLLDLDRFKSLNDTLGHQAGDEVLRKVGQSLKQITRATDVCARYGGEEFALIVPATTPKRLEIMADRVRDAIKATDIAWAGRKLSVTVSVGGACLSAAKDQDSGKALIRLADENLYAAKDAGRDCCKVAPDTLSL